MFEDFNDPTLEKPLLWSILGYVQNVCRQTIEDAYQLELQRLVCNQPKADILKAAYAEYFDAYKQQILTDIAYGSEEQRMHSYRHYAQGEINKAIDKADSDFQEEFNKASSKKKLGAFLNSWRRYNSREFLSGFGTKAFYLTGSSSTVFDECLESVNSAKTICDLEAAHRRARRAIAEITNMEDLKNAHLDVIAGRKKKAVLDPVLKI